MNMVRFAASLFPSDPSAGQIGCIEYNIWMAHIFGVPLPGLRKYSLLVERSLYLYGTLITVLCSFIYTGFEIYDLFLCWPDFDAFTQNFCLTACHISGIFKIINIFYRLPDLKGTLNKLKTTTRSHVTTKAQQRVFHNGDLQNKVLLTVFAFMVGFTGFAAMVMLFSNPAMAGQMFPYHVTLPDWLSFRAQLAYMGFTAFIFALQIVTIDFLNVALMNLLRFHLRILNLSFDALMLGIGAEKCAAQSAAHEGRNSHLKSIVQHHCVLIELRADVERIFRVPLLVQFFSSLLVCAVTGFRATVQSSNTSSATIIYFYGFCIFSELFFYCWFGNDVFEQSRTLATSGYNSPWYHFDARFKRSLLIFLVNAQRPFLFTAGGFMGLSLSSFVGIVSKAYSFIAVLHQMYNH